MQQLTRAGLREWLEEGEAGRASSATVGVIHAETDPLAGVRDAIAVWAHGHEYVAVCPPSSPALVPAFMEAVGGDTAGGGAEGALEEVLSRADAVVAGAAGWIDASLADLCTEQGIPPARRLLRDPCYSVGLVDGHESQDEMGRLAEDALLYEGHGRRTLKIFWAPTDHPPDDYLQAMAGFRGLFPAHEDTPGSLQMQQAFLEAQDRPHAYAEGLEFLMSRGDPERQKPGHVRWAEYDAFDDVDAWWRDHQDEVYAVIARPHLHDQLPDAWPLRSPGGVHVPPLADRDGRAVVSFLEALA
jgi:hypothetical protein